MELVLEDLQMRDRYKFLSAIVTPRPIALAMTRVAAHAAPPTADEKAAFFKQCVAVSQNQGLCKCKADAAMTLVDSEFMAVIIASMSGKPLAHKWDVPYSKYIAASTKACGMGGA